MKNFREILLRNGVSPHVAEAVMLDVSSAHHRKKDAGPAWHALITKARAARTSVTSNRPKRRYTPVEPIYEEYAAIINEALERIYEASTLTLEDGQPVSPKDIETKRLSTNRKREQDGRPLVAECAAHAWYTWIAPDKREEFQAKVDAFYRDNPTFSKSNRFRPFVQQADKQALANANAALRAELAAHRTMFKAPEAPDTGSAYAYTPFAALQLCMVAAAYRELRVYTEAVKAHKIDPVVDPLPKDWRMLLSADQRARLRAAEDNPPAATVTEMERILHLREPDNA